MDCSLPGSSVHGIFQTRILERVAISFSRGSFQSRDGTHVSCIADGPLPLSHWKSHSSLRPYGLYSPWNSPGQNTGVGSHSLLQRIFSTQGSNPGFLHCKWILYQLSHQGSPRIPGWVAYPFSRESSGTRNQIGVSCIAGGFFTSWATREALLIIYYCLKKDYPQAWWLKTIHISYPTMSLWLRGSVSAQLGSLQGCTRLAGRGWGHLKARLGWVPSAWCWLTWLSVLGPLRQTRHSSHWRLPRAAQACLWASCREGGRKPGGHPKGKPVFLQATHREDTTTSACLFLRSMSPQVPSAWCGENYPRDVNTEHGDPWGILKAASHKLTNINSPTEPNRISTRMA